MYLYPAVDPDNEENWWTVTDPARVVSGAMDDFVAEYTKPVIPPRENMRAYPSYKPQVQRLYMSLDVEWEAEWSDKDWISFATFSLDNHGDRVLGFNLTKNMGFHFGHTLSQNSNVNIWTKPLPYEFPASFNMVCDIIADGTCTAYVDGELVAKAKFEVPDGSQIYLTHYGLYTSKETAFLKVRNSNLKEYGVK